MVGGMSRMKQVAAPFWEGHRAEGSKCGWSHELPCHAGRRNMSPPSIQLGLEHEEQQWEPLSVLLALMIKPLVDLC